MTPASATPNSLVEIAGRWLGTAKGKVLENGKPAFGVVWNGASGKIQSRAPKKTGLLDLQVVTPVGAGDVRSDALAVNAGVTGKTRMRFTIGGREVMVTDESQIQASLSHPRTGIAEVGFYAIQPPQNANEGRTVVSLSGRVPDGTLLPYTVPNTADEDELDTYVSYDRAGVSDGNPNTIDDLDFYSAYQGIMVEITGIDCQTNRISGRAFGALQKADYLTGTLDATAEFTCEFNFLLDQRLSGPEPRYVSRRDARRGLRRRGIAWSCRESFRRSMAHAKRIRRRMRMVRWRSSRGDHAPGAVLRPESVHRACDRTRWCRTGPPSAMRRSRGSRRRGPSRDASTGARRRCR